MAIGAMGGAIAAFAARWDALTKAGGPSILWAPLVIAVAAVAAGALVGGLALYWQGRKDLTDVLDREREAQRADEEAIRADEAIVGRQTILDELRVVSESVTRLVEAPLAKHAEYRGVLKQRVVESALRVTREQTECTDARAVLIEYDQSFDHRDTEKNAFIRGPSSGRPLPIDIRFEDDSAFARAARRLLDEQEASYLFGDANTTHRDIAELRLPGDADHFFRARVSLGTRRFGIMCVDTWGTTGLRESDLSAVFTIINILATALASGGGPRIGQSL